MNCNCLPFVLAGHMNELPIQGRVHSAHKKACIFKRFTFVLSLGGYELEEYECVCVCVCVYVLAYIK